MAQHSTGLLCVTWMADSVAASVAFSCLSSDTATATKIAPAAFNISTDSLIAVPRVEKERNEKCYVQSEMKQ
jgi:hypothetical protein